MQEKLAFHFWWLTTWTAASALFWTWFLDHQTQMVTQRHGIGS